MATLGQGELVIGGENARSAMIGQQSGADLAVVMAGRVLIPIPGKLWDGEDAHQCWLNRIVTVQDGLHRHRPNMIGQAESCKAPDWFRELLPGSDWLRGAVPRLRLAAAYHNGNADAFGLVIGCVLSLARRRDRS